jgi:microcystin-dependent protein
MSFPIGAIIGFLGADPNHSPSDSWLPCNGTNFDGIKYYELAQLLGNNLLPDLTGLSLIGASSNDGHYPPSTLGGSTGNSQNSDGTYGAPTHLLTIEEMPPHQHFGYGNAYANWPYGLSGGPNNPGSSAGMDNDNYKYGTTFMGGNTQDYTSVNKAFSLIQPSFALHFFIRAQTEDT